MPDFIRLSCPSCGGKLEVPPELDRFACSYCGNELVASHAGGIVSLKPVVDKLTEVGVSISRGTDRTTDELTLQRLDKEIAELQVELKRISNTDLVVSLILAGVVTAVIGGALQAVPGSSSWQGGALFVVGFIAWVFWIALLSRGNQTPKHAFAALNRQRAEVWNRLHSER